jgi:hypothetical protein
VLQQVCCDVKQEPILQVEDRESKRSHASGQNRIDTAFWKASSKFFRSEISRGLRHKILGAVGSRGVGQQFRDQGGRREDEAANASMAIQCQYFRPVCSRFQFTACLFHIDSS